MDVSQQTFSTEKIDVPSARLLERAKELLHEGNVRRIIIRDAEGNTVVEVPVAVGVLGLLAAPRLAAIGAVAAFAADYSIEVERDAIDLADQSDASQR